MPKLSKKHKFRGIPYLKKETIASVPYEATGPNSSTDFSSQSTVDDKPMPTISECKLQPAGFVETDYVVSVGEMTKGYRLIDLQCLDETLKNAHVCAAGESFLLYLSCLCKIIENIYNCQTM